MTCNIMLKQNTLTKFRKTIFSVSTKVFSHYDMVNLSLLGDYQIQNCITVLIACHVLKQYGLHITKQSILSGIEKQIGQAEWKSYNIILL